MTHQFSLVPALMLGALVSEAISRSLTKHNFYDEILSQDGIVLVHVIPPRDLRSWQAYPVSAIANFRPVVIEDLAPENLGHSGEKPVQAFSGCGGGEIDRLSDAGGGTGCDRRKPLPVSKKSPPAGAVLPSEKWRGS